METDEREGLVRSYLDTKLPDNWDELDIFERRNFLSGTGVSDIGKQGAVQRKLVCNLEIWCECFGKDAPALKKADSYELGAIMQKLGGWEKFSGTKDGSSYFSFYGKQKAYDEMKHDLVLQLPDGEITAANAAALSGKLCQMAKV